LALLEGNWLTSSDIHDRLADHAPALEFSVSPFHLVHPIMLGDLDRERAIDKGLKDVLCPSLDRPGVRQVVCQAGRVR